MRRVRAGLTTDRFHKVPRILEPRRACRFCGFVFGNFPSREGGRRTPAEVYAAWFPTGSGGRFLLRKPKGCALSACSLGGRARAPVAPPRDRFLCRRLGRLGRFHLQPALLGVEEFADFVDQLVEAGWVFLFCGKAAEMHPVFFGLALHGAS